MNIECKYPVMIFKNEKGRYTAGISKKNQDGTFDKGYMPIKFNKGVELENKTLIAIKNAWLSVDNWEYEGKKYSQVYIRCNDFEKTIDNKIKQEEPKEEEQEDPFEAFGNEVEIDEDSLPF